MVRAGYGVGVHGQDQGQAWGPGYNPGQAAAGGGSPTAFLPFSKTPLFTVTEFFLSPASSWAHSHAPAKGQDLGQRTNGAYPGLRGGGRGLTLDTVEHCAIYMQDQSMHVLLGV